MVWIFPRSLDVICYDRWVLSESHKIISRIGTSWTCSLPSIFNLFLTSKGCKPDNFEPHPSMKFSLVNIWGLCSNFVECESFLESNFSDILAVWDKLWWVNWLWQFLKMGKDFSIHMHSLLVYVKEGLPFSQDLSLENSGDSYLCLRISLLHSVSYFSSFGWKYWSHNSLQNLQHY